MGEFDPLSRTSVCLCKITQWSHFINENTTKTDKKLSQMKNLFTQAFVYALEAKAYNFRCEAIATQEI